MERIFKLSLALALVIWNGLPYAQAADVVPKAPAPIAIDGVTQEADSWRLPEGHFVSAKMPMTIIHPRSFPTESGGDETSSFARHKHAYPGIEYRIPVSVQGGAYPFYYEVLEGPAGMAIGQKYGDPNYGELYWTPNNQDGPHPVRVRITDQDLTQRVVEWTINVGTSQFVFVDPNAPPGGNGTIGSPLKRFAQVHGGFYPGKGSLGNPGTTAYSEKIVYLREGIHQTADIPTPFLSWTGRPTAILGYPGEYVEMDHTNGQIRNTSSDFFWGGITSRNSPNMNLVAGGYWADVPGRTSGSNSWLYALDNSWSMENGSRLFELGARDRKTFFRWHVKEFRGPLTVSTVSPSLRGAGNSSVIFSSATSAPGARHYITAWDASIQDQHGSFIHLFGTRYGVAENVRLLPDSGGPYKTWNSTRLVYFKEQNTYWSVRRCVWTAKPLNTSDGGGLYLNLVQRPGFQDFPIFVEAAYNLMHSNGVLRGRVLNYDSGDAKSFGGSEIWVYRNTLIGSLFGVKRNYTVTFESNVMMLGQGTEWDGASPAGGYPASTDTRKVIVGPVDIMDISANWQNYLDNDYLLKGSYRADLLGIVGHEISGFGSN